MIYEIKQPEKAAFLFDGWQETLIWSCLQGVMGKLYGDSENFPESAMAVLGDFCFVAGKPSEELLRYRPEEWKKEFMILVPENEQWQALIEACYKDQAEKITRYAIKKEPDCFEPDKLWQFANALPEGYMMKMMDRHLFFQCRELEWCRDWVAQYETYEMYQKYGAGAVILKDGEPVSGASSYSSYRGGIEIEIDTREDHRRKGLATVCGARLILECLERKWYPSWDAQNLWSVALAEKLGYHFDHSYVGYALSCGA